MHNIYPCIAEDRIIYCRGPDYVLKRTGLCTAEDRVIYCRGPDYILQRTVLYIAEDRVIYSLENIRGLEIVEISELISKDSYKIYILIIHLFWINLYIILVYSHFTK